MSFQLKNIKTFNFSSNNTMKNNNKDYGTNASDLFNDSSYENNKENEFNRIMKAMLSESETISTRFNKLLYCYLRKNRKIINDLIEKIMNILNTNNNIIYFKALIQCIEVILDLLIEHYQKIYLISNTIPLILTVLFQEKNIKDLNQLIKCVVLLEN